MFVFYSPARDVNPLLSKVTSFSLAAHYALLVVAGHALHDHVGCGHAGHCVEHEHQGCDHGHAESDLLAAIERAAKQKPHCSRSCSCEHDHHALGNSSRGAGPALASVDHRRPEAAADSKDSVDRLTGPSHDPHSCLACQLISQLNVGYSILVTTDFGDALPGENAWSHQAPFADSVGAVHAARGPPTVSA